MLWLKPSLQQSACNSNKNLLRPTTCRSMSLIKVASRATSALEQSPSLSCHSFSHSRTGSMALSAAVPQYSASLWPGARAFGGRRDGVMLGQYLSKCVRLGDSAGASAAVACSHHVLTYHDALNRQHLCLCRWQVLATAQPRGYGVRPACQELAANAEAVKAPHFGDPLATAIQRAVAHREISYVSPRDDLACSLCRYACLSEPLSARLAQLGSWWPLSLQTYAKEGTNRNHTADSSSWMRPSAD